MTDPAPATPPALTDRPPLAEATERLVAKTGALTEALTAFLSAPRRTRAAHQPATTRALADLLIEVMTVATAMAVDASVVVAARQTVDHEALTRARGDLADVRTVVQELLGRVDRLEAGAQTLDDELRRLRSDLADLLKERTA